MTTTRRRLRRTLLPLLAGLAAAACDLTSEVEIEAEDVLVAEAYLRPGVTPAVFLHRTLPGDGGSLRVEGATVWVEVETGTSAGERRDFFPIDPADDRWCVDPRGKSYEQPGTCYLAADGAFPAPGTTYRLRVSTADGRALEGTTTVPGSFEIRRPALEPRSATGDTCAVGNATSLELLWTAAEGAWSYQAVALFTGLASGLRDLGVADPPNELELVGLAISRTDTTLVFPAEFGVFDRFDLERDVALALQQGLPAGAVADIVVAAGDRNFVNWVRGGNFNPSGQVRVPSVVGDGTGVFGSLVPRHFTVVTDTASFPACDDR